MKIPDARRGFVRKLALLTAFLLALITAGCGSGNNGGTTNSGLLGYWNFAMYPTDNPNPAYVFALAISQEGGNNYTGSPITYTGSVPIPTNMCIDSADLQASATTNGSNFTLTIDDPASGTVITVQGSLASQTGTLSGTYSNPTSQTCPASSGTMSMSPQQ